MKKACCAVLTTALIASSVSLFSTSDAQADPAFKKRFEALYVKKNSTDPKDMAFAATVKKAKCNLCHKGKKKKNRNAYGEQLAKLLDRKKDRKNKEKIDAAIKKVAEMKSDAGDENSLTYGELIAQGKLPAGDTK